MLKEPLSKDRGFKIGRLVTREVCLLKLQEASFVRYAGTKLELERRGAIFEDNPRERFI
ncbi:MAG: hypothetical protein PUP91_20810 [Rhizonema sp. PD37]|nr:hypothetical protein [Rhizonema sp. PD37]